jgi:hypothetical protein
MALFGSTSSLQSSAATTQKTAVFNEVNSIAKDIETTVLEYTVPGGQTWEHLGASATGKTDTVFKLYIDGSEMERLHNNWCERNVKFIIQHEVTAGLKVKITAEHGSNTAHDFSASIFGDLT